MLIKPKQVIATAKYRSGKQSRILDSVGYSLAKRRIATLLAITELVSFSLIYPVIPVETGLCQEW